MHGQIAEHFCIQGWSGVAKWGGVRMRDILEIVQSTPDARECRFLLLLRRFRRRRLLDVHKIHNMNTT